VNRKSPEKIEIDQTVINAKLADIKPVEINQVRNTPDEKLFNSLIEFHHYLGYCHPVGEQLKYMIYVKDRSIACFSWFSAPRHIGAKVSIKRLLRMLFGSKTEKKDNVLKNNEPSSDDPDCKDTPSEKQSEPGDNMDKEPNNKADKNSKGHGRTGADKYTGANSKFIPHSELKHGDPCPLCPKEKVYNLKVPGVVVRISVHAPLQATRFDLEKFRCNLCGEVFTAIAPGKITGKYYDETAKAMITIFKIWQRLSLVPYGKTPGEFRRAPSGIHPVGQDRISSKPHLSCI
jgi:hypothetical protein